jgi:hypothetical protein
MVNRKGPEWLAISFCKHRIGGSIPLFGSQHCDMACHIPLLARDDAQGHTWEERIAPPGCLESP